MKRIYLAEKKSQGYDLATVLNGDSSFTERKTYIKLNNGDYVTWCSGHLLALAEPHYYNDLYKVWSTDDLPILPDSWAWLPIDRVKYQLESINKLLANAQEVVVCSDYDREGQLLAVNVLNYCKYTGKTTRVKLTATDATSIQRALDHKEDLELSMGLYRSALARIKSDWAVGLNMTRLFTCIANSDSKMSREVINIGRVITPTVNLIVQREKEIKNFKSQDYYEIESVVTVQNGSFKMTWEIPKELLKDESHCFDKEQVQHILDSLKGNNLTIDSVERKESTEQPPLPFSLSKLQIYAAKKFNLTPKQTLDICQSLYDSRHKLTTYPRSDCQYLPESQFDDAPTILNNLSNAGDDFIKSLVIGSNAQLKSRAFNDKKMVNHAHNAIIPSLGKQSINDLDDHELKIYKAIVLHYIAQFYPAAKYDEVIIKASCNGQSFIAKGKVLIAPGYRVCFKDLLLDEDKQENVQLPNVKNGEIAYFKSLDLVTKQTRAPKRFDNASLIESMTNVGKFVDNKDYKQILNETYGLGTEPTRPIIIENIIKYGWAKLENKFFVPTQKAIQTMAALPNAIKSPVMTATWEKALDEIVNSKQDPIDFEKRVSDWITTVINTCLMDDNKVKIAKLLSLIGDNTQSAKSDFKQEPTFTCQKCQSPLKLIDGKYGKFFICSNDSCKQKYQYYRGKPMPIYDESKAPRCPKCNHALRLIKTKTNSVIWKCQNQECAIFIPDMRGTPIPGSLCPKCNSMLLFKYKGPFGYYNKCLNCQEIIKL